MPTLAQWRHGQACFHAFPCLGVLLAQVPASLPPLLHDLSVRLHCALVWGLESHGRTDCIDGLRSHATGRLRGLGCWWQLRPFGQGFRGIDSPIELAHLRVRRLTPRLATPDAERCYGFAVAGL